MTNLQKFEFFLKDLESPDIFIRFNWYFLVASCLERRIWLGTDWKIYPNIYIMFVAKPGFGKTLPAKKGEEILRSLVTLKDKEEVQIINTAPDTVSFEKLLIILASPGVVKSVSYEDNVTRLYEHTSVSFCLGDEVGTLLRDHTTDVVTMLTKGWDCGSHKTDTVKHGPKCINNMCINLLGCCTPSWIGRQVDNNNLHEGFSGRVIFIYGDKPRKRTTTLQTTDEQRQALLEVRRHLVRLTQLRPMKNGLLFNPTDTPEAYEWFDDWVQTKMDIHANESKHLEHYYGRKKVHLLKLAMLIHFSESLEMKLTVEDLQRALKELELNEMTMHLALSASARNPVYTIASNIMVSLKLKSSMTYKGVLVAHFDNGNEEDIMKALHFLVNTGQVITFNDEKHNLRYKIKQTNENTTVAETENIGVGVEI